MNESERGQSFCPHGNNVDSCEVCMGKSTDEVSVEAKAVAPKEFKINEVRDIVAFLEREEGRDIIEADLSLIQTKTNTEKKRTTFVFQLDNKKATQYFQQPTFYEFMNEPFHIPPRYEVDRVYCNSEDVDDIMFAETIFAYENGEWKKV